jgi:hypothetical protein
MTHTALQAATPRSPHTPKAVGSAMAKSHHMQAASPVHTRIPGVTVTCGVADTRIVSLQHMTGPRFPGTQKNRAGTRIADRDTRRAGPVIRRASPEATVIPGAGPGIQMPEAGVGQSGHPTRSVHLLAECGLTKLTQGIFWVKKLVFCQKVGCLLSNVG